MKSVINIGQLYRHHVTTTSYFHLTYLYMSQHIWSEGVLKIITVSHPETRIDVCQNLNDQLFKESIKDRESCTSLLRFVEILLWAISQLQKGKSLTLQRPYYMNDIGNADNHYSKNGRNIVTDTGTDSVSEIVVAKVTRQQNAE